METFVFADDREVRGETMMTVLGWKRNLRCLGMAFVTGGTIFVLGEALIWWILEEIKIFYSLIATIPLSFVFFHNRMAKRLRR